MKTHFEFVAKPDEHVERRDQRENFLGVVFHVVTGLEFVGDGLDVNVREAR